MDRREEHQAQQQAEGDYQRLLTFAMAFAMASKRRKKRKKA